TISGVTINDAGGYIDQSTPGFTGSAALAITCDPASPTLVPQGDPASPAAGSSATCTATYTVTQADVNAGAIKNTATAQGTGPGASAVAAVSNPSPVTLSTTTLPPPVTHPSLSLSKTVNQSTVSAAGTTLGYSFVVMNTGDVAVSGIAVNDPMVGAVKCPATTLAVGASMTCTASYTVTQANMDAGSIVNTATAAGVDPSGGAVDSNASSATVTVIQNPQLSLTKSAVQTTLPAAGQTIDFLFLVKNTGNVTVNNVAINDAMFPDAGAITCPVTTLVPGDSTTCTASYVVTNADVIAGSVVNTATAIGAGPSSSVVRGAPVASNQSKVTLGSLSAPTGGGVGSLTPMWPMFALVMAGALLLVIGYRRKVAPQATSQTGRHAA
ncbi:MAG: hypothetical protein FWF28_08130, partial [Micrococcales bacterium]|nr:hypothetical protein [Micrococcales bacterium]